MKLFLATLKQKKFKKLLEGAGLVLLLLFLLLFSLSTKQVLLILNKTSFATNYNTYKCSFSSNKYKCSFKVYNEMRNLITFMCTIATISTLLFYIWSIMLLISSDITTKYVVYTLSCVTMFVISVLYMIYKCNKMR